MSKMNYNESFFLPYLEQAPVALAVERTLECQLYIQHELKKPVLDIGCGEGMFARLLFSNKVDVGIDPNQEEIDRAKTYNAYDELICCFGDKIPKPDKSFATIFSNSVLEHIPDLKPVLKEAHRLMADDGRFYITIPTNYFEQNTLITKIIHLLGLKSLEARYRKFFNSFWAHYHYYSVADWKKLFSEQGFEVERCTTYCKPRTGIFNDVFAPIAIIAFIQKKFFNRWFLLPSLRKPLAWIHSKVFSGLLRENGSTQEDGLVFFVLKKS